jgi:hypothetical protein
MPWIPGFRGIAGPATIGSNSATIPGASTINHRLMLSPRETSPGMEIKNLEYRQKFKNGFNSFNSFDDSSILRRS